MKLRFILFTFLAVWFAGCSSDDLTPGTLELASNSIYNLDNKEHVLKIAVQSNMEWQVTGATNWCQPDKLTGYGNDTLRLNVSANTLSEERTAAIILKNSDARKTVWVNQHDLFEKYHYKLPVIFHILYNDAGSPEQNMSAERINRSLTSVMPYMPVLAIV